MKLQQIKYLLGLVKNNLNVSKTAESLFTSQPGVSRQIKLLEEELNVEIFERHGRSLTGITPIGNKILKMAADVADTMNSIKCVAEEYANESNGSLYIATTHTQTRYVLPRTIINFTSKHSSVSFHLKQANPYQVCEMVSKGLVDLAVASEAMEHFSNLITLPCYSWNRVVLVKRNHPLLDELPLTLQKLSMYPLVTYESGFAGCYKIGVLGILPPNTAKTVEGPVFTGLQATINFNLARVSVSSSAFGSKNEQNQATINSHCR